MAQRCCKCGTAIEYELPIKITCEQCNRGPFCLLCMPKHQEKCQGPVEAIDPEMLQIGSHRKAVRAPLNYPGNKTKSLEYILPALPYRGAYIEVFGGSGAVLLARKPEPLEVYNDRFGGICCFFRVIRDRCEELMQRLDLTIHSREEFEWCRASWKSCADEVERAARWYYSMYYSFSGKGEIFGRNTKPQNPYAGKLRNRIPELPAIQERLRHTQIENLDWRDILNDYDQPHAVFYLDPPYYEARDPRYRSTMSPADHRVMLARIFDMSGFVALSGYANALYDHEMYPWTGRLTWNRRDVMDGMAFTPENNREKATRGTVEEVLWLKEAR